MEDKFILSVDQGTTGTTVLVVDLSDQDDLKIIGRCTVNFRQYFPKADWVEHDLDEIWSSVARACEEACMEAAHQCSRFKKKNILAIGITNQRETLCVYDRKDLKVLSRAIVWQCKRSSLICEDLRNSGLEKSIREKTGLFVDPYFTGTKIKWLIENNSEIAKKLKKGTAILGTMDSFLISKFGGGRDHKTEASNASRTLLYNIHEGKWDSELVSLMGLPSIDCLAEVQDSVGVFTKTKGLEFLPDGIPITGVLGDQQAALAGQRCFSVGEAKCTYGTGAFLLLNVGKDLVFSKHKLLTTVAWQLDGRLTYALEGASFVAGAALQFLRDNLGILKNTGDSEALARTVLAAPEIIFVPALSGLGAPWWEPKVRGAFLGLTRATTKAQLVRACLEGVAFQVCDLIESMKQDYGDAIEVLRVDGGAASNSLLLEIQAQFAGLKVERPHNLETTAMGAILFAGLGVKVFSSIDKLKKSVAIHSIFEPNTSKRHVELVQEQKKAWLRAIHALKVFSDV